MGHLSLYRKYRSQSFGDLVGQNHVVRTLQNAIQSGRISHAYLFTGPRGTGKTSSARLLAKALNCENGPSAEPCNVCPTCISITEGSCFDVNEMDAASEAGVDDVREKIVQVAEYPPSYCRYRIFIIDEVHDLSRNAFDALLKTIEEPPERLVFILATTEYVKVPPTIRSRCQKYEFHRGSVSDIAGRLQFVVEAEGMKAEPAAINAIARMADGGFRDALTLLEQAALVGDGDVTLEGVYDQLGLISDDLIDALLVAIKERDAKEIIDKLSEATQRGRDPRSIVESAVVRLADLTRAAFGIEKGSDGAMNATLFETAARIGNDDMLRIRTELATAHNVIRDITLPRLWLESELIRIAMGPVPVRADVATKSTEAPKPALEREREAPTAAPKQSTESKSQSRPQASTQAVVETPIMREPTPTGDDQIDRASKVWVATVNRIAVLSKTLGMKLAGTSVAAFDGHRLVISFSRELDKETAIEGPKSADKRKAIAEALHAEAGESWGLDYVVMKKEVAEVEPIAVELPAEGERLAELANEVFQSGG